MRVPLRITPTPIQDSSPLLREDLLGRSENFLVYFVISCLLFYDSLLITFIFPHQVGQIASLVIDEFIKLASAGYGETEFRRAKKQLQVGQFHTQSSQKQKHIFLHLQSMLLMNLESRPVVFEDLARQVLSNGERKQPEYYIERIEAVTAQDLNREPSDRTN